MTDSTHRTPGDDTDREIAALRAELRAGGLLPDLPAAYEPTEASAEAMLQRVLASRIPVVDEPVAALSEAGTPSPQAPSDDDAARARVRATARQAAVARRRRATLTQTLFGLAATVLVGAVIVVPLSSRSGDEAGDAAGGAADQAFESIQPMGAGLDPVAPRGLEEPAAGPAPLVGVVVDVDGCLAVQQDETGTVYVPVDTPDAPVRDQLRVGERVSISPAPEPELLEDIAVPDGCDPAGPFWPAASLNVLVP